MLSNSRFWKKFEISEVYEGVTKFNFVFPKFRYCTVGANFEKFEVSEFNRTSQKRISEPREFLDFFPEFQNDVYNEFYDFLVEFIKINKKMLFLQNVVNFAITS